MGKKLLILSFIFLLFVKKSLAQTAQTPSNGDVRLVGPGSTTYRGRVEVFYLNRWRTIAISTFSAAEANVTCRALGFTNGGTPVNSSIFGIGTGYIWGFQCGGSELSVLNCLANSQNANTSNTHLDDAGVECRTQHLPGDVRIIETSSLRGSGYVEVFYNGQWGAVCNDYWSINNARVICRDLGYGVSHALAGTQSAIKTLTWPAVTKRLLVGEVNCRGTETKFSQCAYSRANLAFCNATKQYNYATVTCVNLPNDIPDIPIPTLSCDKNISASFSKVRTPSLLETHISLASGAMPCKLDKYTNATWVTVSMGFFDCGTENTTNATHITYRNGLLYKYKYHMPIGRLQTSPEVLNTHTIMLTCHILREVMASQCILPNPQTIFQEAMTSLQMRMELYLDGNFQGAPATSYPLQVTLNQLLAAKLILDTTDPTLKLVRDRCWASPSPNISHPLKIPLFEDKCPVAQDLSFFDFDNIAFGFNYKIFKLNNYTTICIHCVAHACLTSETTGLCDRRCLSRKKRSEDDDNDPCRRKRDAERAPIRVSSPVIQLVTTKIETPGPIVTNKLIVHESGSNTVIDTSKSSTLKVNICYISMLLISAIIIL